MGSVALALALASPLPAARGEVWAAGEVAALVSVQAGLSWCGVWRLLRNELEHTAKGAAERQRLAVLE